MLWFWITAPVVVLIGILCLLHLWVVRFAEGLTGRAYDRCCDAYEDYLWNDPWPTMSYTEFEREYRRPKIGPGTLPNVTPYR